MNGTIAKAKEIARKEVLARIKTLAEAKEDYKNWIKKGLSSGFFDQETINFWQEVINAVDEVTIPDLDNSKPTNAAFSRVR